MVLLIIIPMKNGYFIGNIPNIFRQTHLPLSDVHPSSDTVDISSPVLLGDDVPVGLEGNHLGRPAGDPQGVLGLGFRFGKG